MAGVAAWRKLAVHQLQHPSDWVLKLVQAAAAAQAESLVITQTRVESCFTVKGVPGWTCEQVEQAVLSNEQATEPDLHHLSIGLRALLGAGKRPVSIDYPDQISKVWNGQQFEERKACEQFEYRLGVSHYQFNQATHLLSPFHVAAREYLADLKQALEHRCLPPFPLRLDGRLIEPTVKPRHRYRYETRSIGFFPVPTVTGGFRFQVQQALRDFDVQALGLPTDRPCECGAAVNLSYHYRPSLDDENPVEAKDLREDRSLLVWVLDGVMAQVENLPFENCVTAGIALDGSGLPTDLSSLAVSDTPARRQRRRNGLLAVASLLESAGQGSLLFCRPHHEERGSSCFLFGCGGLGLALTMISYNGLWLVFFALLAGLTGQANQTSGPQDAFQKSLRDHYDKLVDQLKEAAPE